MPEQIRHPMNNPVYPWSAMARPTTKRATDFGIRLTQARNAAGLTQMQLAERLSLSQQMIDYYERRAKNPTADFVRKAAMVLNVSADQLLGHEVKNGRKPGPASRLEQRLSAVRQLPRDKQKLVLQFLDAFLRDTQTSKAA
jgi:transcriptional regulator with XRE-family HTH domain